MHPKSICLVRLSALGDVLMFVPLVRTLQRALPETQLTWVIAEPAYSLVEGLTGVEFMVIKKPAHLSDYWRFKKQLNGRVFDVLIAAQASLRANLLYACISAKRKIGYDQRRAKDGHGWFVNETISPGKDHTLEGFLKFAHPLGITEHVIDWNLVIPEEAVSWASQQVPHTPFVVINPAASKPERSWEVERYIQLIQYLQQTQGYAVVLSGGPSAYDKALGDAIAHAVSVTNLIGQTKPKQLLAVLKKARFVICPDTGPSHMAAAVGTPVIALHAVTYAGVSGPYPFLKYAVDKYPEAVARVLGKTMETCPWGTHVHGEEAMRLISVEDVIQKVETVVQSI
jgi:heptosyltransferase I